MAIFTAVHVVISLVAIAAGLVVLHGLLTNQRYDRWTKRFLLTTLITVATGFGFPVDRLLPSHVVGAVCLATLGLAALARYTYTLRGVWRPVYVVNAVLSLYLNVFVLVVQLFLKVPALNALAPTQSETPFAVAQLAVLALFVALGAAALLKFRGD